MTVEVERRNYLSRLINNDLQEYCRKMFLFNRLRKLFRQIAMTELNIYKRKNVFII